MARKPTALKEGSRIGIVTPGAPLGAIFGKRMQHAIAAIESFGLKTVYGEHALKIDGYVAASGKDRAEDINAFVKDDTIDGIFCTIGGLHYNQLLPYIDFESMAKTPKVLLGFSDTTVLQLAYLAKAELVSFSGPALLTQFAEFPAMHEYTKNYLEKALFAVEPIGAITASANWTETLNDWEADNQGLVARPLNNTSEGFVWKKTGSATGKLVGGCIGSMLNLAGTPYWPKFDNSILLLETPEGHELGKGEPIQIIDMQLANLKNIGVFEQVQGVVLGRGYGYSEDERNKLIDLVAAYFTKDAPLLANVDYGHTDPLLTLPIGCEVTINSEKNQFTINESGVC